MISIFKEKSPKKRILLIVFCFVFIIFIISSIISIKNIFDFLSKIHSSDGVIVSVAYNNEKSSSKYSYEVEFYDVYDNFCTSSIDSNKAYDIDNYVKVYYMYTDHISFERDNPVVIVIPIICIGIMIILGFLFRDNFKGVKVDKNKKKLLSSKTSVYAKIENVIRSDKNNMKYYKIVCSWVNPDDGTNYTFYSEDLDFDPTMSIRLSNKNSLNVHLDKNNYNNYIVDVNDIKNNRI